MIVILSNENEKILNKKFIILLPYLIANFVIHTSIYTYMIHIYYTLFYY